MPLWCPPNQNPSRQGSCPSRVSGSSSCCPSCIGQLLSQPTTTYRWKNKRSPQRDGISNALIKPRVINVHHRKKRSIFRRNLILACSSVTLLASVRLVLLLGRLPRGCGRAPPAAPAEAAADTATRLPPAALVAAACAPRRRGGFGSASTFLRVSPLGARSESSALPASKLLSFFPSSSASRNER